MALFDSFCSSCCLGFGVVVLESFFCVFVAVGLQVPKPLACSKDRSPPRAPCRFREKNPPTLHISPFHTLTPSSRDMIKISINSWLWMAWMAWSRSLLPKSTKADRVFLINAQGTGDRNNNPQKRLRSLLTWVVFRSWVAKTKTRSVFVALEKQVLGEGWLEVCSKV